jgi:hypothetical protein
VATLVAAGLIIASAVTLSSESHHLKVAKKDAFDSLVVLSQARAVSYDANADESRYLVDPQRAAQYQQAFFDKSQQVVQLSGATIFSYDTALAGAFDAYRARHADVPFGGYLGSEFRNITFTGERAAAEQTLATWQVYQRDDRRIRAFNAGGDLNEAIRFDTSHAAADSNGAFDAYDAALTKLTAINQAAFDGAIHQGERHLRGWAGIPVAACLLVVALVVVGTWPRLAEYG